VGSDILSSVAVGAKYSDSRCQRTVIYFVYYKSIKTITICQGFFINYLYGNFTDENMKNIIGKRIVMARKDAEINQEILAQKMGVSRHTIVLWENEKYSPSKEHLQKLSKVLNKPIEYFYEEDIYSHKVAETKAEFFSTPNSLLIKKAQNGYIVNYGNDTFIETDFKSLTERLKKVFNEIDEIYKKF
jgi:DNA-binding XRE family transcriptional regulator